MSAFTSLDDIYADYELLEADARPARLWLRRHGAQLHRIGG